MGGFSQNLSWKSKRSLLTLKNFMLSWKSLAWKSLQVFIFPLLQRNFQREIFFLILWLRERNIEKCYFVNIRRVKNSKVKLKIMLPEIWVCEILIGDIFSWVFSSQVSIDSMHHHEMNHLDLEENKEIRIFDLKIKTALFYAFPPTFKNSLSSIFKTKNSKLTSKIRFFFGNLSSWLLLTWNGSSRNFVVPLIFVWCIFLAKHVFFYKFV